MADGWAEYLEASFERLSAARTAVERGAPIPPTPPRPTEPLPPELRADARRLATAYDQLVAEVSSRLADINRHRRSYTKGPTATPYYLDRRL